MRVRVTKYCKLHAYLASATANTGAEPFDSALQIDRENPFSVNTDWGMKESTTFLEEVGVLQVLL